MQGEYIILIGGWNGVNRSSEVFVYNTVNEQMNMAVSRGIEIARLSWFSLFI